MNTISQGASVFGCDPSEAHDDGKRSPEDREEGEADGRLALVPTSADRAHQRKTKQQGNDLSRGHDPDQFRGKFPEPGVHVGAEDLGDAESHCAEERASQQDAKGVVAQGRRGVTREAGKREERSVGLDGPEPGDDAVGSRRRDQYRRCDQDAGEQSQLRIIGGVEAPIAHDLAISQEDKPSGHRDRERARPPDQPAVAHETCPLVVVGRHFRAERAAWHHVEGEEETNADRECSEPGEELALAQAVRWGKEQVDAKPHRESLQST